MEPKVFLEVRAPVGRRVYRAKVNEEGGVEIYHKRIYVGGASLSLSYRFEGGTICLDPCAVPEEIQGAVCAALDEALRERAPVGWWIELVLCESGEIRTLPPETPCVLAPPDLDPFGEYKVKEGPGGEESVVYQGRDSVRRVFTPGPPMTPIGRAPYDREILVKCDMGWPRGTGEERWHLFVRG